MDGKGRRGIGRGWREGAKGGDRVGKGGGVRLGYLSAGAPGFLVTPARGAPVTNVSQTLESHFSRRHSQTFGGLFRVSNQSLLVCATEVTTLLRYTNMFIITSIIISDGRPALHLLRFRCLRKLRIALYTMNYDGDASCC